MRAFRSAMVCIVAIAAFSLLAVLPSSAAQSKRSTGAAAHPAPKVDPARILVGTVMANSVSSTSDLYQACKKASFKSLAWALYQMKDAVAPAKGEYETAAEFQARVSKLTDAINGSGEIIVCQPLNDNDDAPFAYDADAAAFKGSFRSNFNVWRDAKRTGAYVSRTRMGARATVQSSIDIEYDLTLGDRLRTADVGCLRSNYSGSTYTVPMPRDQAPLLKMTGYLVFRGHLVPPFIEASDTPGSPTLDDPTDVYERSMTVQFAPTAVQVVGPGGMKPFDCVVHASEAPQAVGQAIAKGAAGDWVTADDYPPSALRNNEAGVTGVKLDIDATGHATDCTVTSSSGFPDLDQTACRLLPRRARFTPAKDAAGNGVTSTYTASVPWRIPKD